VVVEEWLTVKEVAEQTKLPETTCRRYLDLFSDFIKSRALGRTRKYEPGAVDVVARIAEYYQAGQLTPEIRERLGFEYGQTIDIESATKELAATKALEPAQVGDLIAIMNRQNELLETLGKVLLQYNHQQQEIEDLRSRLEQIEQRQPWWRRFIK
jgi:DNA-binding IclR family transcriptional regulator